MERERERERELQILQKMDGETDTIKETPEENKQKAILRPLEGKNENPDAKRRKKCYL
jgi:hypothetical protein